MNYSQVDLQTVLFPFGSSQSTFLLWHHAGELSPMKSKDYILTDWSKGSYHVIVFDSQGKYSTKIEYTSLAKCAETSACCQLWAHTYIQACAELQAHRCQRPSITNHLLLHNSQKFGKHLTGDHRLQQQNH